MSKIQKKKKSVQSKKDLTTSNEENNISTKSKTLFDHINHIRENKSESYYDQLTEKEKRDFSKYTLLMGLSMDPDSIESIAYLSQFMEVVPNKQFYKACCDLVPSGRKFCKWIKSTKSKTNKELIDLLSSHLQIGKDEARDYCKVLFKDQIGIEYLVSICSKYGKTEKEINKLLKDE